MVGCPYFQDRGWTEDDRTYHHSDVENQKDTMNGPHVTDNRFSKGRMIRRIEDEETDFFQPETTNNNNHHHQPTKRDTVNRKDPT